MTDSVLAIIAAVAALVGVGVGAVAVPLFLDRLRDRRRRPGRVWTREDDDELARWREGKI